MTLQGFLETIGIIYLVVASMVFTGNLQEGKEPGKAAMWAILWPIHAIIGMLNGDN